MAPIMQPREREGSAGTGRRKDCNLMNGERRYPTGSKPDKFAEDHTGPGTYFVQRQDHTETPFHTLGLPLVYIIGDSHVSAFSGVEAVDARYMVVSDSIFPNVRVCRLGAPLAATMHNENSTEGGRRNAFQLLQGLEPKSFIFLSFGEIDCRVHIPRRAGFDAAGIGSAVTSAMKNYFSFVDDFRATASEKQISIGLLSPPPTASFDSHASQGTLFRLLRRSRGSRSARILYRILKNFIPRRQRLLLNNAQHPTYADDWALRNQALRCMRDQMQDYCNEHRLPFIDMFEPFLEPDGRSADQWFMDNIHLSRRAIPMVAPQFQSQGISNFTTGPK